MSTPERPSAEQQAAERYPMPEYDSHTCVHTTDTGIALAVVFARREGYAAALTERSKAQPSWGRLTDSQYKIIADRMIEEHRKYGDKLRDGHWAEIAARKVASHIVDFKEAEKHPAEEALRLAMDYISALGVYYQTGNAKQERDAWYALRANPIAAKMLEE